MAPQTLIQEVCRSCRGDIWEVLKNKKDLVPKFLSISYPFFEVDVNNIFKGALLWAYSEIGIVGISQTILCSRATLTPE